MTVMRQFAPRGPLALDPRAYGVMFAAEEAPETRIVDGVAFVYVRGPLAARSGGWCDSYEAILERVASALAKAPRRVVLDLDSPGGAAQGCFEAARQLRAACRAAAVPLHAYVSGAACSAAYALACAADDVFVTPTAVVGSIGVYEMLASQADADAALGLAYRIVATGERKADGNPHVPISDSAVAAAQAAVDSLGELFFALVEEMRGVPASQVRALDGAIAIGRAAVARGLADREVLSVSQLLEMAAARTNNDTTTKEQTMDEIKKALQAVIDDPEKSDDEKDKAKRALAALSASDNEGDDGEDDDKDDDKGNSPDAQALAARALAEVHKMRAEMARRDEEVERATLLASRPDFAPELVATLRKAPMATVREMVEQLPRVVAPPAAAASVQPTLGEGQTGKAGSRLPPEAKAKLDAQMGLAKPTFGVVDLGSTQLFGAPVPVKRA
jgi:ClpP class serine protease